MRLERRQQQRQLLNLQVTRTHNGKFLVSPNASPDPHQYQSHHQQFTYQSQQQVNNSESDVTPSASVVSPVAYTNFEPHSQPTQDSQGPTLLGDRFLLLGTVEGSTLYKCVDVQTEQQLVAKALTVGDKSMDILLQAHLRLAGTGAVSGVAGIVDAGRKHYLLFDGHHGDLHAYVRARRRLRESEARRLFKQAAKAVATCHENGVVLRDLKLRKFVFANEARTKLQLESLEDAVLVDDDNDKLSDRRGCPAYVAPEVLRSGRAYSGKAADMWSLGVLLYTMLVGRYPFNDAEHASLFAKISRGHFAVPEGLTPRARCLVRGLLRREPSERPVVEDVLRHPWLTKPIRQINTNSSSTGCHGRSNGNSSFNNGNGNGATTGNGTASLDQLVPEQTNNSLSTTGNSSNSSSSSSSTSSVNSNRVNQD